MSPMAIAHTTYASGAAGPSAAATSAGRRKIPPPTVTLMIPAASAHVPIARTSERSVELLGSVTPRAIAGATRARLRYGNAFESSYVQEGWQRTWDHGASRAAAAGKLSSAADSPL